MPRNDDGTAEQLSAWGHVGPVCGVGSRYFCSVAKLAAHVCGADIAGVSIVGPTRAYVGMHGMESADVPRERSFCARVVETGDSVVVADVGSQPWCAGHDEVVTHGVKSYAGVPVVVDGVPVGAVCVMSREPRVASDRELDMLRELAALAAAEISSGRQEFVRKASQELGRLLEVGIEGFAMINLDPHGRICSWNDGAERLYQRPSHAVLGRPYHELMANGADPAAASTMLAKAAAEGRASVEGWNGRGDGSTFWARGVVSAIRDGQGLIAGFANVVRDESELHRSQELSRNALRQADEANERLVARAHEVDEARARAEIAVKAKGAFLENVSHELRTPLTAIMGFVELLTDSEDLTASSRRELLDSIRRNGLHLLAMVGDLIDLSRLHGGDVELQVERFSPERLAAEVVDLMRHHAVGKGVELSWRVEGALPATMECDARRVRQVLLNLVGNAIKFTEHGNVELIARLGQSNDPIPMPMLEFEVRDTGSGIPREALPGLFNAFSQADNSSARRHSGAGLGLALCKRLTELLGGRIRVETEEGKGTTFVVSFQADVPERMASSVDQRSDPVPSGQCRVEARVLLVDDGADNRKLIGHHLRKAGAVVETAEDGQQGVDAALGAVASGAAFGLIVLDMQMPVMDGWTAASKLREAGVRVPILALTANVTPEARERCLSAGCTSYISKPVDRSTLLEICSALVRSGKAA